MSMPCVSLSHTANCAQEASVSPASFILPNAVTSALARECSDSGERCPPRRFLVCFAKSVRVVVFNRFADFIEVMGWGPGVAESY